METTQPEKTPAIAARGESEYPLGYSEPELGRLSTQSRLLDPLTRRLFEDAGLRPGMRVLDVGCGHGDVTLLAARMVGPSGEVVALDRSPSVVEAARRRTAPLGNVEVVASDVAGAAFDEPFDAVVGRAILMYCPDPSAVLSALAASVRPGGLFIFHEFDLQVVRSEPVVMLYEETVRLALEAMRLAGGNVHMGLRLAQVFKSGGLPAPAMRYEAVLSREDDPGIFEIMAALVQSLLPTIERFHLATADDLDVETLAARMQREAAAANAVVAYAPLVGAYARKSPQPGVRT